MARSAANAQALRALTGHVIDNQELPSVDSVAVIASVTRATLYAWHPDLARRRATES